MISFWCLLLWITTTLAFSNNGSSVQTNSTVNITSFSNVSSPFGYTNGNTSNSFHYRGVALGGWLLLEPWITPLLFNATIPASGNTSEMAVDEYTFCQVLGKDEALKRLHNHWTTFYNESDIQDIKNYGFNMVRVPIGYWAFEMLPDDPYVPGAREYLDKVINWLHKYDLKVWIDVHGVPGSQNGFDNSGRFLNNTPGWQNSTENIDLSHRVLRKIYTRYGSSEFYSKYGDTILGIEVVNEPMGPKLNMTQVEDFYEKSYKDARVYSDTNNTIVFHDAFQPAGYWDPFLNSTGSEPGRLKNYNILIDHHHYEVFSAGELNSTISTHLNNIRNYAMGIQREEQSHPAVVGEWSAALTDCTPWLNSVHFGTRWEGTFPYTNKPINNKYLGKCANINNWETWSKQHKRFTRKYIEMQLDQYESKMNGWIFWTYKTENSIEWDFKKLAKYELFPQPFSKRQYIVDGVDTKPETGASARLTPKDSVTVLMAMLLTVFLY